MKAVDTNVLVRFALDDDPMQAQIAAEVLSKPCFAPPTVVMESAWVILSLSGKDREAAAAALRAILGIPTLAIDHIDRVRWAIDRFVEGADMADMMHLIASASADAFVTFDRRLAKAAGPDTPVPVETLA